MTVEPLPRGLTGAPGRWGRLSNRCSEKSRQLENSKSCTREDIFPVWLAGEAPSLQTQTSRE